MYNKVIILGNIVKDAKAINITGDKTMTVFRIVSNHKYKTGEDTCFINCVSFSKLANKLVPYLLKGKKVMIEGRLRDKEYETTSGEKRHEIEVVVEEIKLLGSSSKVQED